MNIAIFGLSLSSSWGNGHAVTYRSLIKGLHTEGHTVHFFERDADWYRFHRDLSEWPYCQLHFYRDLSDLASFHATLQSADAIIIGTYVRDAGLLFRIMRDFHSPVLALYDIDTPITLADLRAGRKNVFDQDMIAICDLYLSFTGGSILDTLTQEFHARLVRPLYCSVDPDLYKPTALRDKKQRYALSYLGTYSDDRQLSLERFLFQSADLHPGLRFIVAGAQYPATIRWPSNVEHCEHVPPSHHPCFYAHSRTTLNLTRAAMMRAGYSPSIRLFEAASCETVILTDDWAGLSDFFTPGHECLVIRTPDEVNACLSLSEQELGAIRCAARERVLAQHTGRKRAQELVVFLEAAHDRRLLSAEPKSSLHVE